jgi:hydroxypyruvate reductase
VPNNSTAEIELLRGAFDSAVRASAPEVCLPAALAQIENRGPALVLGAGKAAAAMAASFAANWPDDVRGLVVTRYEHGLKPAEDARGIEVIEAGHPSPDSASLDAGAKLLSLATHLRAGEALYCLISGGGSSLAAAPVTGLSFDDKRNAANFLMHAGADIREINCVRKHLSGLKGGRLAAVARPAPVTTFAISDVPGDNIADIASGPTIPDRTTQADARAILARYQYPELAGLERILSDPALETPKPEGPGFAADRAELVATAATALAAAEAYLTAQGLQVLNLGGDLDDEAQTLGREHARLAKAKLAEGQRLAIISGGETRVILSKTGGRGGRNLEYVSGLALELDGCPGVFALAADTDGIDGHGGHAGGIVVPDILERGAHRGLSLVTLLRDHDSYSYFDAVDLLVRTGPTRTNVNDFRIILCHP